MIPCVFVVRNTHNVELWCILPCVPFAGEFAALSMVWYGQCGAVLRTALRPFGFRIYITNAGMVIPTIPYHTTSFIMVAPAPRYHQY